MALGPAFLSVLDLDRDWALPKSRDLGFFGSPQLQNRLLELWIFELEVSSRCQSMWLSSWVKKDLLPQNREQPKFSSPKGPVTIPWVWTVREDVQA